MLQQICIFSISMHFFWKVTKPSSEMAFPCYYRHYFWMMFLMPRMSYADSSVWKTRSWRPMRSASESEPVRFLSRMRKMRSSAFLNFIVICLVDRS